MEVYELPWKHTIKQNMAEINWEYDIVEYSKVMFHIYLNRVKFIHFC
jgi:hypothetical protein